MSEATVINTNLSSQRTLAPLRRLSRSFILDLLLISLSISAMSPHPEKTGAAHSDVTLALAKKESAEHMHGMDELYLSMRTRALTIKAFAHDDPKAPSGDHVKTVHFVRHGQGFHNLMADLAQQQGLEWVQVGVCMRHFDFVLPSGKKLTYKSPPSLDTPKKIHTLCPRCWMRR